MTATRDTTWTISDYGAKLHKHHAELLMASAVAPAVSLARDYRTVETKAELGRLGFGKAAQLVPTLLVPVYNERGENELFQHRPDEPRRNGKGPIKYETPFGAKMTVDVPPGARDRLADPAVPLFVTEGVRKADAAVSAGLCCVALLGVWNWRGSNSDGGKTALAIWESVALKDRTVYIAFDSDVMLKPEVNDALVRLGAFLKRRGAHVAYIYLPTSDGGKVGLDDYLASGGKVSDLMLLAKPEPLTPQLDIDEEDPEPPPRGAEPQPRNLTETLRVFRRWLHLDDTAPVLAVAATIVANRAPGDPTWLLVVGPPSGGKTEIISSAAGLPYIVKAATVSEAALLSGTAGRERAANATGGLLRMVGDFGILLCKDFTSVLSQNRDTAKQAMAALREVYDGSWDRPVGTDGGKVLSWAGKCGLVGGVTPSFDRYSTITTALGDRFLLLRLPDVSAAEQAASALNRHDHDAQMRAELAAAMTGLIHGANLDLVGRDLTADEQARLIALATYTARARTAVERDGYTHELVVIPQAEGPARLVLGLRHLYGGLEAIGADEPTRWEVVARVARDCVHAIRHKLICDLVGRTDAARTSEVAAAVGMVTKTAHQHLEDLALLGLASRTKTSDADNAPDQWSASDWLRQFWPDPESEREKYVRTGSGFKEETIDDTDDTSADTLFRTSRSHFDDLDGKCRVCETELHPKLIALGETTHPGCDAA